jgi:hypothetical protein
VQVKVQVKVQVQVRCRDKGDPMHVPHQGSLGNHLPPCTASSTPHYHRSALTAMMVDADDMPRRVGLVTLTLQDSMMTRGLELQKSMHGTDNEITLWRTR